MRGKIIVNNTGQTYNAMPEVNNEFCFLDEITFYQKCESFFAAFCALLQFINGRYSVQSFFI